MMNPLSGAIWARSSLKASLMHNLIFRSARSFTASCPALLIELGHDYRYESGVVHGLDTRMRGLHDSSYHARAGLRRTA